MLSAIYGKIVDFRNALFDRGVFRSHNLGARTISVGNITTGGTGKTPLTAYVASILADRGEKVCILTRGYGRKNPARRVLVSNFDGVLADAATGGDEPVELATKLLGKAVVIADANRVAAGLWAKAEFGITAFVLDDGFQHRKVSRDVDIVCIDANDAFGSDKMLPAGRLREPVESLERDDIAVIVRSEETGPLTSLRKYLQITAPKLAIFEARKTVTRIRPVEDGPVPDDHRFLPFCGLGNPESFRVLLVHQGVTVAGFHDFADHHWYSQADIETLNHAALEKNATAFLTTGKDAVKLVGLRFNLPVFVVEINLSLDDPEGFAALL